MRTVAGTRPAALLGGTVATLALALGGWGSAAAGAVEDRRTLQEECGSCHLAYPAAQLSPGDWGRVLDRLADHYGVDATLDPVALAAAARALGVSRDAPRPRSEASSLPRITTSAHFRDEHDEIPAAVWRRPAIRSAANCDACHANAARGDFDEDNVRIPR